MPCRCAADSASAISVAIVSACSSGSGPFAQALAPASRRRGAPSRGTVDAVVLPDVVERADVRVVQAGDRLRLALEAGAAVRVGADTAGGRTLMATVRSRRVSRALYTSPMPPAPIGDRISYGPSAVPGVSGVAGSRPCRRLEKPARLERPASSDSTCAGEARHRRRTPRPRTPPLVALGAFESASRHTDLDAALAGARCSGARFILRLRAGRAPAAATASPSSSRASPSGATAWSTSAVSSTVSPPK